MSLRGRHECREGNEVAYGEWKTEHVCCEGRRHEHSLSKFLGGKREVKDGGASLRRRMYLLQMRRQCFDI